MYYLLLKPKCNIIRKYNSLTQNSMYGYGEELKEKIPEVVLLDIRRDL